MFRNSFARGVGAASEAPGACGSSKMGSPIQCTGPKQRGGAPGWALRLGSYSHPVLLCYIAE